MRVLFLVIVLEEFIMDLGSFNFMGSVIFLGKDYM